MIPTNTHKTPHTPPRIRQVYAEAETEEAMLQLAQVGFQLGDWDFSLVNWKTLRVIICVCMIDLFRSFEILLCWPYFYLRPFHVSFVSECS